MIFFNHPEGYVEPDGSNWDYIYQYKDHLGNIRLSYSDANGNGSIATSEIREENNYYPFGLKQKGYNAVLNGRNHKYGFTGKEGQDELGLGWVDITARNYDPALGRWMNLDPLAEVMRRYSPYTYSYNSPIYFMDPDGRLASSAAYNSGGALITKYNGGGFLNGGGDSYSGTITPNSLRVGKVYEQYFAQGAARIGSGETSCCGGDGGSFIAWLINSINGLGQNIGSNSQATEEHAKNLKLITGGFKQSAKNINEVQESFDFPGTSPMARLGVAVSDEEESLEKHYARMNHFLGTDHTVGGDLVMSGIFFVPGGGEGRFAGKIGTKLLGRNVNAFWGKAFKYRHGGRMTAIEHIIYRHSFKSGFVTVSKFSQGTSALMIKRYVDQAVKYGTPIKGGFEYNFGRAIGTGLDGKPATSLRVFIKDGWVRTAFPF